VHWMTFDALTRDEYRFDNSINRGHDS
jgi:hypothetical protein